MCNKAAVDPVTSSSVPPSAPSSCVIKKSFDLCRDIFWSLNAQETLFSAWYVWWFRFPPRVGWSCPVVVKLMPGASKVCSCVVRLIPSCCSCIEGLNWTLWCYNQPYATFSCCGFEALMSLITVSVLSHLYCFWCFSFSSTCRFVLIFICSSLDVFYFKCLLYSCFSLSCFPLLGWWKCFRENHAAEFINVFFIKESIIFYPFCSVFFNISWSLGLFFLSPTCQVLLKEDYHVELDVTQLLRWDNALHELTWKYFLKNSHNQL